MKIYQEEEETDFKPIHFTLDTLEEVWAFWDAINRVESTHPHRKETVKKMTDYLSNWFSNEAQL